MVKYSVISLQLVIGMMLEANGIESVPPLMIESGTGAHIMCGELGSTRGGAGTGRVHRKAQFGNNHNNCRQKLDEDIGRLDVAMYDR